jgi:uncharacterized protein YjbJ (UPF0337 family)
MSSLEAQGNWNILRGSLRQSWSRLTHDSLQLAEGRFEEIVGRVQKQTGETCRRLKISSGKQEFGEA